MLDTKEELLNAIKALEEDFECIVEAIGERNEGISEWDAFYDDVAPSNIQYITAKSKLEGSESLFKSAIDLMEDGIVR